MVEWYHLLKAWRTPTQQGISKGVLCAEPDVGTAAHQNKAVEVCTLRAAHPLTPGLVNHLNLG